MNLGKIYALFLGLALWVVPVAAANLTVTADELAYNGQGDVATATGNVVIERDGAVMTGAAGEYHFADGSAVLSGGVTYKKDSVSLQAAEVRSEADGNLTANGSVQIWDGTRSLAGDTVFYRPSDGYGTVDGNAALTVQKMRMTAAHIEAFTNEIRVIGTGGVTLVNEEHGMTANAEWAEYTQTPNRDDGYVILKGNARVVQEGNVLTGPRLDVRVADRSVETKGRSTLIIQTKE